MQQYLTYLCTDINETDPTLVTFLRVDQLYVLRFLFCRVYVFVCNMYIYVFSFFLVLFVVVYCLYVIFVSIVLSIFGG